METYLNDDKMNGKNFYFGWSLLIVFLLIGCKQQEQAPVIFKGDYLGQALPGDTPELFDPGFISTGLYTRDMSMTPEMDEIYFCVSSMGYNLIFFTKQVGGVWTEPEPVPSGLGNR